MQNIQMLTLGSYYVYKKGPFSRKKNRCIFFLELFYRLFINLLSDFSPQNIFPKDFVGSYISFYLV